MPELAHLQEKINSAPHFLQPWSCLQESQRQKSSVLSGNKLGFHKAQQERCDEL